MSCTPHISHCLEAVRYSWHQTDRWVPSQTAPILQVAQHKGNSVTCIPVATCWPGCNAKAAACVGVHHSPSPSQTRTLRNHVCMLQDPIQSFLKPYGSVCLDSGGIWITSIVSYELMLTLYFIVSSNQEVVWLNLQWSTVLGDYMDGSPPSVYKELNFLLKLSRFFLQYIMIGKNISSQSLYLLSVNSSIRCCTRKTWSLDQSYDRW